jgi:hypothetical protein
LASEKKSIDGFEAAIRRELQNASRAEVHDCPAPDVLAAYYDRSLARSERASFDSHLISCPQCQSMMAAIARADDTQPSLPPRETVRGLLQVARVAAPIAIIGAGIAFMVGMRTRSQHALQVAALASPAAQLQLQYAERAAAPPPLAAPEQPGPTLQTPLLARKEIETQQLAKAEAPPAFESFNATAPAPGAPPVHARAAGGAAFLVRKETAVMGSAVSGAAGETSAAPMIKRVASPDGTVMWQFGTAGAITRSENSGSWVALHSGVTSDLLAASAPSSDVCWLVGKSAIVLRTLDRGAHWQIVTPPSREDFTTVTATDSNNATVIASSGKRYVTHDGGVTWASP